MNCIILWLFIIGAVHASENDMNKSNKTAVIKLLLGQKHTVNNDRTQSQLTVFEHSGLEVYAYRLFIDVQVILNLTDDAYRLYQSSNHSQVLSDYAIDQRPLLGIFHKMVAWRTKHIAPFDRVYVGIDADYRPYTIQLRITNVDFIRLIACIVALVVFFTANKLVRNAFFYYTSGCTIGVLASLLLAIFVVYRFTPKRAIGIPLLVGGWSFSLYLLYAIWNNFYFVLQQYQKFIGAYLITVLLLSFGICYRFGPPTDRRSHDLAQWTLQLISVCVIYATIQIPEISLSLIASLGIVSILPSFIYEYLAQIWRKMFPKQRRLLTELEYEYEARVETEKALRELREHCRSPNANAWRITSRLSSPQRFAEFVEGKANHVNDDEINTYEMSNPDPDLNFEHDDDDDVGLNGRMMRGDGNVYRPQSSITTLNRSLQYSTSRDNRNIIDYRRIMSTSYTDQPTSSNVSARLRSTPQSKKLKPQWRDAEISSDESDVND